MKLFEYLDTLPKGRQVSIGAVDGSAFIYCGDINKKNIDEAFKVLYKQTEDLRRANLIRMKTHEDNIEQWESLLGRRRTAEINRNVSDSMRILIMLKKRVANYEKKMAAFVFAPEREVIEHYRARATKNMTIILVNGREAGFYWFEGDTERRVMGNNE